MSYRKGHQYSLKEIDQTQDAGIDSSKISIEGLKVLWRKTLESGMHGLCFSLYEDGQRPGDTGSYHQIVC